MNYVIKVKSLEKWVSLLEELERKGWSWNSGHNPTEKKDGVGTVVTTPLRKRSEYRNGIKIAIIIYVFAQRITRF